MYSSFLLRRVKKVNLLKPGASLTLHYGSMPLVFSQTLQQQGIHKEATLLQFDGSNFGSSDVWRVEELLFVFVGKVFFEYISQNQMHVRNKYPADTYCKSFRGLKFEAPKYWRSLHRALKPTEPDCQAVLQYVYTPTCVLSAWRFLRGMQVLDVLDALDAFGLFCILQNKGSSNKEV